MTVLNQCYLIQIQGFNETDLGKRQDETWQPVSDRKIRLGIAGYDICCFGSPQCEMACCEQSLFQTVAPYWLKSVPAFLATDVPSHARYSIGSAILPEV